MAVDPHHKGKENKFAEHDLKSDKRHASVFATISLASAGLRHEVDHCNDYKWRPSGCADRVRVFGKEMIQPRDKQPLRRHKRNRA